MTGFFNFLKRNFGPPKMTFNLDNIKVNISEENNEIRLTTEDENWFIPKQTLEETKTILDKNFRIIKEHFLDKIGLVITETNLNNVCLKIGHRYFQMYNHWRTMYKRETNRDLTFLQKDFEHPYTSDTIVDYFKKKHPDNYVSQCEIMLNMTTEQVREYVIRKEQFDNR